MKIVKLTVGMLPTNCYIVYDEQSKNGIVFDPGDEAEKIFDTASENGISIKYIMITHAHFDHIIAVSKLKSFSGAKICMHKSDIEKITDKDKNFSYLIGKNVVEPFVPDVVLQGGEQINLDSIRVNILHTPGHSEGQVCYILNDSDIICGDTIFKGSFGRYDNYDGSLQKTIESLKKLFALNGNFVLHCGHGEDSDLDSERKYNEIKYYL